MLYKQHNNTTLVLFTHYLVMFYKLVHILYYTVIPNEPCHS